MNHSPAFLCDIFSANSNSNKNVPGLYRLTGSLLVPEPARTSIKNRPPLQPGILSHSGRSRDIWAKVQILAILRVCAPFGDGEFTWPFFQGSWWPSRKRGSSWVTDEKSPGWHLWGINLSRWKFLSQQNLWHKIRATRQICFWLTSQPGVSFGVAPGASNGALHTCTWKEKMYQKMQMMKFYLRFIQLKEAFHESLSNSQI